jgi:carboxylate-amine ligase
VGVEEEFLLVDPHTGVTVPCADRVLARHGLGGPLPEGATIQRELRPTQMETSTGVCTTATGLREHLTAGRRTLAAAAAAEGCAIVATATPTLASPAHQPPAPRGRFARIDEAYGGLVSDYEACGCHVHVGVPDRDTAVAVVNHLGRWLPTLLALSGNSPFERGRDTGYQSWRMVQQSRFPGSGPAPFFSGHAEYREAVAGLVSCGALVDENQTFWLARPSPRFPTVELRVADTALTVGEALLQALLSRALVRTALDALARGTQARPVPAQTAAAAVWSAARHGLSGRAVDPLRGAAVPATSMVAALLAHVRHALEDTGDLPLVRGLLERLEREGTGAARQRRAAAHGLPAVHRLLIEHTPAGEPR